MAKCCVCGHDAKKCNICSEPCSHMVTPSARDIHEFMINTKEWASIVVSPAHNDQELLKHVGNF